MPNGGEAQARADRYRARYEQNAKARRNGLERYGARDLPPYRVEMESDSQVTAGPQGLTAKGIPRFAWWPISIGIGLAIVMFAWRAIQLAR